MPGSEDNGLERRHPIPPTPEWRLAQQVHDDRVRAIAQRTGRREPSERAVGQIAYHPTYYVDTDEVYCRLCGSRRGTLQLTVEEIPDGITTILRVKDARCLDCQIKEQPSAIGALG